jgi:hypothetical protein
MNEQQQLFELPEAKETPLTLKVCPPVYNYIRRCKGQHPKVNLRDYRTGKIVATIYGGEDMAKYIAECVNGRSEVSNDKNN